MVATTTTTTIGYSPSKDDTKKTNQPSDESEEIPVATNDGTDVSTRRNETSSGEDSTTKHGIGAKDSNPCCFENSVFRLSAEDTLAKATSLATFREETESFPTNEPNGTETESNSRDKKHQPRDKEISIERLRDLINQHPKEFWKPQDDINEAKSSEKSDGNANPIGLEQTKGSPSPQKSRDTADCDSKNPTKRRKIQQHQNGDVPPQRSQQANRINSRNDPHRVVSIEDREILQGVRSLLEESLQQLPTTDKMDNLATNLLEHLSKANPVTTNEGKESKHSTELGMDVQDMAHRVTLSFAADLSEILKAVSNTESSIAGDVDSSIDDIPVASSTKPTLPSQPPKVLLAAENSLLCDEEDLAQLKEANDDDDENKDDSDDDEIIEISQDENFVQQHLICNETEETLFGNNIQANQQDSSNTTTSTTDDRLFAQKVALLRETKRLIRAKTLELTKRRLGIKGDEDLTVVI